MNFSKAVSNSAAVGRGPTGSRILLRWTAKKISESNLEKLKLCRREQKLEH